MVRSLLCAGLACASLAAAQMIDGAAVDAIARTALAASKTPGAGIAIVRDDKVVYLKGHGVRRIGSSEPVTPDTLFCIGSLTKVFTTTAMAMLVDEGRMAWDDPVRKHLPYFRLADPLANANVTLRDLVTHRTGVASHDFLWLGAPWSLEETIRRIASVKPSFPFRATYHYNNIMYNTAGYAVAHAAGMPWQDFVAQRIFSPLGMKGVKLTATEAQQAPDHGTPHRKHGGQVEVTSWYQDDHQIRPAGSIKAGVRDMSQWLRFQLGDGTFEGQRLVSSANLREIHTPQIVVPATGDETHHAYAMGWHVADYRGHLLWTHAGSVQGFHANLALLPREHIGIVMLSNLDASWMPLAATRSVMDLLLGLPKKDWNVYYAGTEDEAEEARKTRQRRHDQQRHQGTKPSREVAAYAGAYEEPAYGTAQVSLEGDALVLRWSSFRLPLAHYHFDTFDATGERRMEGEQVQFSLDPDGDVAGMKFLAMNFQRPAVRTALNYDEMAEHIVNALALGEGERVLMRYDPSYFSDLIAPLERRIRARKAVVLPALTATQPLTAGQLAQAGVFLWLPLSRPALTLSPPERALLARWLDEDGAHREIHFHWAEGSVRPDGLPGEHSPALDKAYQDALEIDYHALSAAQDRAIQVLRTSTVRVRTPEGTDVMFRTGNRPFDKQDGDASRERMKTARVRVDREIELPAGVLRVAPVEESVSGQIAIPEARFGGQVAKNILIQIDNGRVTRLRAGENQAAVEAALASDSARSFREFALGFSPKLVAPPGSPSLPYYGYGAGVVRLSLGDNEELGGKVRGGFTRWFFFPDASVEINGRFIVRNGKLAPELEVPTP